MTLDVELLLWGLLPLALALLLTPLAASWARRRGVTDKPGQAPERKIHQAPVPLLGGVAVFLAFSISVVAVLLLDPSRLVGGYLHPKHLVGILLGATVLMVGGYRDDRFRETPRRQILWPIFAALVVIASGIGIEYVTNPFGPPLRLDQWAITLFTVGDTPYRFVLLADLFAFAWLLVSMYTTKFLDGLDGLVGGITVIGMIIVFVLSLLPSVGQPETALLALLVAGSFLGFLLFNFHPAKIFLGEGGSVLAGFLLATLAILSGGKIATALLILGIPMLDLLWVVLRRLFRDPRSITAADRRHLHFRLLDIGLSHRQAVIVLYAMSAVFGGATLFTAGKTKAVMLALLAVLMLLLAGYVALRLRRRRAETRELE